MLRRIKPLWIIVLLAASLTGCTAVKAAPAPEVQAAPAPAIHTEAQAAPAVQTEVQAVPARVVEAESPAVPRTIVVLGQGKVSLKPDIATINVGAETRTDTVSEGKAEVDAKMASILTALKEAGVAEQDIQSAQYSIQYERDPMAMVREAPAQEGEGKYRVSNMVRVTVHDVEKAADVLDAVVQAGANQMYGVTFTVSDENTWESEARAKAMADARIRAQELAELAGVEMGDVLAVSEVVGGVPVSIMGLKTGMGGGGIAPGELELGVQIQVTFAIQ
jgi:uncharacterized protein YggE